MPTLVTLSGAPLGAVPFSHGTRFRVWAPNAQTVEVVTEGRTPTLTAPLRRHAHGFFEGEHPEIKPGHLYRYQLDGSTRIPDPASRFQPDGVHGPSEVVDLSFDWSDQKWSGLDLASAIFYEIHVGTFSSEGTFEGLLNRLPSLHDLGVTVLEIMPVAAFPGNRNWGYDGTFPFAPASCYGRPRDLQRFVNEAHRAGFAVVLDFVANHFGPDGNYTGFLSSNYFSSDHQTLWGQALNFDGTQNEPVRDFFIQSALQWLRDYHFDGLRFDATHAIVDESPFPFLAELTSRCRAEIQNRKLLFVAEDHRRMKEILRPADKGGWGMNAVWADDFHHHLRRRLAGDTEGYFEEFTGTTQDLALTIDNGWWVFADIAFEFAAPQFVVCLQNHDQVGNRAYGERLHHEIEPAAYRAATCLLLTSPHTPLLFMGQEWAASTPFLYFTDHQDELGRKVIEGRRSEFQKFSTFADPTLREKIPSPQAEQTFLASRLKWMEIGDPEHAAVRRMYVTLLHLRRSEPALKISDLRFFHTEAMGRNALALRRNHPADASLLVLANLEGETSFLLHDVPGLELLKIETVLNPENCLFSTEDPLYCSDSLPVTFSPGEEGPRVHFQRPGAVIYRQKESITSIL